MNMGHGDLNFESALQNRMFEDAVLCGWGSSLKF